MEILTVIYFSCIVAAIINSTPYHRFIKWLGLYDNELLFCGLCLGFQIGFIVGLLTGDILICGAVAIETELLDRILKKFYL